jgi:hypothetical protein
VAVVRFFFEHGVDTALWPDDVDSPYGYPCDPARLPLSEPIRAEITRLARWYQSSLDWDDPAGPSPWGRDECGRFNAAARSLLEALRDALPESWIIEDRFTRL